MSICDLEKEFQQQNHAGFSQRDVGMVMPVSGADCWLARHAHAFRVLWHMNIVPLPEMPLLLSPTIIGVHSTQDLRYQAEGWRGSEHLATGGDCIIYRPGSAS